MNRIEKLFARALKAAVFPFESWKASKRTCVYCGGGAPDFLVGERAFHFFCLLERPKQEKKDVYREWAEKSEKLWKERVALFDRKDEV